MLCNSQSCFTYILIYFFKLVAENSLIVQKLVFLAYYMYITWSFKKNLSQSDILLGWVCIDE